VFGGFFCERARFCGSEFFYESVGVIIRNVFERGSLRERIFLNIAVRVVESVGLGGASFYGRAWG